MHGYVEVSVVECPKQSTKARDRDQERDHITTVETLPAVIASISSLPRICDHVGNADHSLGKRGWKGMDASETMTPLVKETMGYTVEEESLTSKRSNRRKAFPSLCTILMCIDLDSWQGLNIIVSFTNIDRNKHINQV